MDKNYILGSINWKSNSETIKRTTKEFSNNILNVSVNRAIRNSRGKDYQYFDEKSGIYCTVLGSIYNLEEIKLKYSLNSITDVKFIIELYTKKGLTYFNELDGVFMIFLFDQNSGIAYLYQPFHGMDLPIYYLSNDEKIVFSTSLKSILRYCNKRDFNIEAAKDFLHFHEMVPQRQTLIQDIFKVLPGKYLKIVLKNRKITQESIQQKSEKISLDYAKNNLINTIESSFRNVFNLVDKKNYAITHTKGWDSNLMLYFANKITKDTIQTITINGGGEVNEVPFTKNIKKHYPNFKSITSDVNNDLVSQLVNIVWIYEGYLFQEGTFLRYELAKTLKNNNIKTLIIGAPADQILFPPKGLRKVIRDYPYIRYFLEFVLRRHTSKEHTFRKKISKTVKHLKFDFDTDVILKMHGIMLNNSKVAIIYPFMNQQTEHISGKLGWKNYKKRFYKQKVKEILPEDVVNNISKSKNCVDTKNFMQIDYQLLNEILNSNICTKIITKSQRNRLIKNPKEHHLIILQLIYFYLFNELIISGKYDQLFDKSFLNLRIEEIIYGHK